MKPAKGANPRSAVGRRAREDLRRPARSRTAADGSGTPREEGALWRMTCRRSDGCPRERACVDRIVRERVRHRIGQRAAGPGRIGSPGRTRTSGRQTYGDKRATGRLAVVTPGNKVKPRRGDACRSRERRIRLERPGRTPATQAHREVSVEAKNRMGEVSPSGPRSAGRRKTERRSGVVRRPAAPDSASAASER